MTRDRWMTYPEAADHTRHTEGTLRHLVREKRVPFHKRGRKVLFRESELDAWIRGEWSSARASV